MVFVFHKCKKTNFAKHMGTHDVFLVRTLFLLAEPNSNQCAACLVVMSDDDASLLGTLGFLSGTAFHRARMGSDIRYTTPAAKNRPANDHIAVGPDSACMFCHLVISLLSTKSRKADCIPSKTRVTWLLECDSASTRESFDDVMAPV